MTYLLAGLSYRRSPVAALERVALVAEELPAWLERLAVHAGGGVILSTCNRTEIYGWSDSTESPARLIELLDDIASREGTKSPDFEDHVYSATGVDAARHLFRVASGLDSMATGEAQIAGQVRSALRAAGEAGGVAPRLSRLFHTSLRTARRVRQATGVEKDSISIPSIGVQLLKLTLDELSEPVGVVDWRRRDGDDDRTRPSAQRRPQIDGDQSPRPPCCRAGRRTWRHVRWHSRNDSTR